MAVLCGLVTPAAQADPVADFYKGKEIRLIIGQPPGGGYDTFARLFARHLGRLMPGNPIVIPQNMPGAAGMAMTNSLVAIQPRDGTVIGAASGQIGTAALFGAPGARYDARELGWIGSLNSEVGLVVARKDVPVKRFADLLDHELIVGASFATDSNVIYPTTMNAVLGTKFKIIPGYGGTSNVAIAIDRGEVQGQPGGTRAACLPPRPLPGGLAAPARRSRCGDGDRSGENRRPARRFGADFRPARHGTPGLRAAGHAARAAGRPARRLRRLRHRRRGACRGRENAPGNA